MTIEEVNDIRNRTIARMELDAFERALSHAKWHERHTRTNIIGTGAVCVLGVMVMALIYTVPHSWPVVILGAMICSFGFVGFLFSLPEHRRATARLNSLLVEEVMRA